MTLFCLEWAFAVQEESVITFLSPISVQPCARFCWLFYSSGCYCQNGLISLRHLRRQCYISFFRAHLCPKSAVLVSSADNFYKQFRNQIMLDKTFLRKCAHVQSRISLRCSRGKCYISFFQRPFLFLTICY